jgi:hypothetical protein
MRPAEIELVDCYNETIPEVEQALELLPQIMEQIADLTERVTALEQRVNESQG